MSRGGRIKKQEDILRRIKQGRGQGEGKDYVPWLMVHEVPSHGRSHKVLGFKTGRTHHLLSDTELNAFLLMEFQPHVVDVREQFPLLGEPQTPGIAARLGIRHSKYPGTTLDLVMTTDLLLTLEDDEGKQRLIARTVKRSSELSNARTLEKLELERRYWVERGVPWGIITEHEMPQTLVRNLDWIRSGAFLDGKMKDPELQASFMDRLKRMDLLSQELGRALTAAAKESKMDRPTAVILFKYFAWKRWIRLNLNEPLSLTKPLSLFEVGELWRKK